MHHDVGGHNLGDTALDRVAGGVHLLEAGRARHADGDVDEVVVAGAAHAHTLGAQHSLELIHCCGDALLQARRRGVEQRVYGAFAQPRAHPDDQAGHAQSRERVGLVQPREVVSPANPSAANAEDHHRGAPDVSGEMQRVSLERFALVFPRHTLERSRARDIEQRHHREQADSQQSRLDVHFVEE